MRFEYLTLAVAVALISAPSAVTARPGPLCIYSCSHVLDPVCDIDGNVYTNDCMMKLERCNEGLPAGNVVVPCSPETLRSINRGGSTRKRAAAAATRSYFGGAYAEDGTTFVWDETLFPKTEGSSSLAAATTRKATTSTTSTTSSKKGSATKKKGDACELMCFKILMPVCGDNGVTYANDCLLDMDECDTGRHIAQVPCDK